MRSVGIKVLKNKLSEYVRLAEAGETVLITDRDRVVAELSPPRPERRALIDDPALAKMIQKGILTPALRPFSGPPPRGNPVITLRGLLELLDEDRSDRGIGP